MATNEELERRLRESEAARELAEHKAATYLEEKKAVELALDNQKAMAKNQGRPDFIGGPNHVPMPASKIIDMQRELEERWDREGHEKPSGTFDIEAFIAQGDKDHPNGMPEFLRDLYKAGSWKPGMAIPQVTVQVDAAGKVIGGPPPSQAPAPSDPNARDLGEFGAGDDPEDHAPAPGVGEQERPIVGRKKELAKV